MYTNIVIFAVVYLILDITWIYFMSKMFYNKVIQDIQGKPIVPNLLHASLAYIVLLISMFYICIPLSKYYKDKHPSIIFGLVGFCIYGVYNFTNGAIFDKYNEKIITVDVLWGTLSFGVMGYIYYTLFKRTNPII